MQLRLMVPKLAPPLLLGVDEGSDGKVGWVRSPAGTRSANICSEPYKFRAVRKLTFCACCLRWSFCWLRIGVNGPLCAIASDVSRSIRRRDTLVDEPLHTPHNVSPMDPVVCPPGERAEEGDADRLDLDQASVLRNTSSKLLCQLSFDLPFGDLTPIRCGSIGLILGLQTCTRAWRRLIGTPHLRPRCHSGVLQRCLHPLSASAVSISGMIDPSLQHAKHNT